MDHPDPYRTTGLSRRAWLRLSLAAAAATSLGGCGGRGIPLSTPEPTTGVGYESQAFGYRVALPTGWRRSTHQQLTFERSDVKGTGRDVFTVRPEGEEAKLLDPVVGHAGSFAALAYAAMVQAHENPRQLSTIDWLGQSMPRPAANAIVSGRDAVRINEPDQTRTLYVARGNIVFQVGSSPTSARPEWIPSGWSVPQLQQDIERIAASFALTR